MMEKDAADPKALADLKVKIFADGADVKVIAELSKNPFVKGFTTNPSLMRKAGVSDYRAFALEAIRIVGTRPISLEVFSDEVAEMEKQALEIASWGNNVYVKIPVTTTRGEFTGQLIQRLAQKGVQLNITALLTLTQVKEVLRCLSPKTNSYVSVFAGRVADTGRDPLPLMAQSVKLLRSNPKAELIWASTRELLNIFQADAVHCHVITVTHDVLAKLPLVGKDLAEHSLDTVKLFYQDAVSAGFRIATR
jgi:transaldolase